MPKSLLSCDVVRSFHYCFSLSRHNRWHICSSKKCHSPTGCRQQRGSHRPQTPPPVLLHAKLLSAPANSPVHSLACDWYYCVNFIAKPKAACALRFSWSATSSNLGIWANTTPSIKPEVHNVSLRCQRRTEARPWVTSTKIWLRSDVQEVRRYDRGLFADRQTHADRQTRSSQYCAPLSGRSNSV